MKRVLLALMAVLCFSCRAVPETDLNQKLSGHYGTLASGKKVSLDAVLPCLKRAEWRAVRQSFTVWKVVEEVSLPDGTVIQFCPMTSAFRIKGVEGEFYVRVGDVAPFSKFVETLPSS